VSVGELKWWRQWRDLQFRRPMISRHLGRLFGHGGASQGSRAGQLAILRGGHQRVLTGKAGELGKTGELGEFSEFRKLAECSIH